MPAANPDRLSTVSELHDALAALGYESGSTPEHIAARAAAEKLPVKAMRVSALMNGAPVQLTESLVAAYLAGCGLDAVDREPWMLARKRVHAPSGEKSLYAADAWPHARTQTARGITRPAQLRDALAALGRESGNTPERMAELAAAENLAANPQELRNLARRAPAPLSEPTLLAYLAGCGIRPSDRDVWLAAHRRAYASSLKARRNVRMWGKPRPSEPEQHPDEDPPTDAQAVQADTSQRSESGTEPQPAPEPTRETDPEPEPDPEPDPERPPQLPDPAAVRTQYEFSILIHRLGSWSGRDVVEIVRAAVAEDLPLTRAAVTHVIAHKAFPDARTLESLLAGFGVPHSERRRFMDRHAHLAARPDGQRRPPARMPPRRRT